LSSNKRQNISFSKKTEQNRNKKKEKNMRYLQTTDQTFLFKENNSENLKCDALYCVMPE
jgi:hypothetical protein